MLYLVDKRGETGNQIGIIGNWQKAQSESQKDTWIEGGSDFNVVIFYLQKMAEICISETKRGEGEELDIDNDLADNFGLEM